MNPLNSKGKAQATPTCGPPAMVTSHSALWPSDIPPRQQHRRRTIGSHILEQTQTEKALLTGEFDLSFDLTWGRDFHV